LRTPLTLIRGNAEIGLAAGESPTRNQALTEILAESNRMSRLVDDLLFLARSDAGVSLVEREYLPVGWLLSRLASPAEAMARHHQVPLITSLHGEGHVEVDPERIQQAVLILVDNAARVSPPGSPVELRSSVGDQCLAIDVIDCGPGLPEGEQQRVFERFYQIGPGRTRQRGSAGLGLSIAKSIIDAHYGHIEIESTPGQGTKMTIHLSLSHEM
jgi:signal transduction histidine kinase